jgi:hypothetical protein
MSKQYAVVPHPKLKREYKGRLVRTTRELKNGWGMIPLGAVATVSHQSPKGSELVFEPCDCCGLKAVISHVGMDSIEFIEPITEEKMDEKKLNIETVDGHNELVVSFLSRMVSLSREEKQVVLSCLPDTGKQTITQLYEALRSQGHKDLAEKIAPYLQQGVFGPIFDNANSKVFIRDEAPSFFMGENSLNWGEAKVFNRLRMRATYVSGRGGWTVGERFDDRFDTEVGGTQLIVTQSLNEKGEMEGGLPTSMSLNDFAAFPKQTRPPQIVDYQEDKPYTLKEAEVIHELAPVVERLRERIAEYEERSVHD